MVISDDSTNSFVSGLLPGTKAWIGGHRQSSESKTHKFWMNQDYYKYQARTSFEWVDGTSWSYTNWFNGKPDNIDEKCVETNFEIEGKWNDEMCEKKRSFVCETPSSNIFIYKKCNYELICLDPNPQKFSESTNMQIIMDNGTIKTGIFQNEYDSKSFLDLATNSANRNEIFCCKRGKFVKNHF